ncbi:hypothetical protein GCM10027289_27650 [Tsukamurella serpentis]
MLTDRERAILDFEAQWWQQRGAKEDAITDQFGVTPVRYYQQLIRLIDRPEALAYSPSVVLRLRRIARKGSR